MDKAHKLHDIILDFTKAAFWFLKKVSCHEITANVLL